MENERLRNLHNRKKIAELQLQLILKMHAGSPESWQRAVDELLDEINNINRQIEAELREGE